MFNVGDGHRVLIADGNVFGATSTLQLFPREKAFVILVTNSSAGTGIIESLAMELSDVVAPEAARRRTALFASPDWSREEPPRATGTLAGRWAGLVHTPTGPLPITIEMGDSAAAWVSVGDGGAVPAPQLLRAGDGLEGWADLRLPTRDTEGYPHRAHFSLVLDAGRMAGTVSARTIDDPRSHFVLPFFLELEMVPP